MSEEYKIYKIKKGDNLTKIAKKYNTTVKELVKLNGIKDPDKIYAGADLKIPLSAEEKEAAQKAKQEKEVAEMAKKVADAASSKINAAENSAKAEEKEDEKKETQKGGLFSGLFDNDKK